MSAPLRRAALATAAVAVAFLLVAPLSASADAASDGLWYFDALHVQAALDAGYDGKGVTIAVIDGPINPEVPELAGVNIPVTDADPCYLDGTKIPATTPDIAVSSNHGTNVVSLIVGSGMSYDGKVGTRGVAPGATVRSYVAGGAEATCQAPDGSYKDDLPAEIDRAVADGADIISLSIIASQTDGLYDAIVGAQRAGVILVFGLRNQSSLGDPTYTSTLKGIVHVQSADQTPTIETHTDPQGNDVPNLDPYTTVTAPGIGILLQGSESKNDWTIRGIGDGTSFATPIVAGLLADAWSKYPKATSNQIIQTLIHNTGGADHELTYDDQQMFGYGFVSLTHMLRVDPTQYPDVNPLLVDGGSPSPEEIATTTTPTAGPSATPIPSDRPSNSFASAIVVGALVLVGVIVLIGVLVLVVVLVVRRKRAAQRHDGTT